MQRKYNTKISRKIMGLVELNEEKSFCASDIYSYILEQGIKANLATIYRNLDRLTEMKALIRFKPANSDSFLYRFAGGHRNCHEHLHMQCRECGKIYHLEGDFMKEITEYLERQFGFDLECENSSLSGSCEECKKARL